MLPGHLLHDIRAQKIETAIQSRSKALLVADVDEVRQEVLSDLGRAGRSSRDDRVFVKLVLLRESNRLLPFAVFLRAVY